MLNKMRKLGDTTSRKINYEIRKKLERLLDKRVSIREICKVLGLSKSGLWYERMRMGSIDCRYDAKKAENHANTKNPICNNYITLKYKFTRCIKLFNSFLDSNPKLKDDNIIKEILYLFETSNLYTYKSNKELITVSIKDKIIALYKEGYNGSDIAQKLNVSRSGVYRVIQQLPPKQNIQIDESGVDNDSIPYKRSKENDRKREAIREKWNPENL